MPTYTFAAVILDSDGVAHNVTGECTAERGDYPAAAGAALRAAFRAMTNGNTHYGHPREGSCRGPYTVTKLVLKT